MRSPTDELKPDEAAFERRARAELGRLVAEAGPELRARIDRATDAALVASRRPRRGPWRTWVPLSGLAATVIVLVAVNLRGRNEPAPMSAPLTSEDVAMLLDAENLELLERMEFYLWVGQQPGVLDEARKGEARRS